MAISFGTSVDLGDNGTAVGWTVGFDAGALTDGLIILGLAATFADTITGVTYNGSAMAQITATIPFNSVASPIRFLSGWFLYVASLASGSHNFVVSASDSRFLCGVAGSYQGINATGQPEATPGTNATDSGTSLSASVTVATDQSWGVVVAGKSFTGLGIGAGTGSTFRSEYGTFKILALLDSNAGLSTGSRSMAITSDAGSALAMMMGTFKPSAGGGGGSTVKQLAALGVG